MESVELLIGSKTPVSALRENASIEEFPRPQANRNLPVGSGTMFAKGSVAVNTEAAWKLVSNAPVEELNGNAVIPFSLAAYRNSDAGCVVGLPFPGAVSEKCGRKKNRKTRFGGSPRTICIHV